MDELEPIPEEGETVGTASDKPAAYAGDAPESLSPEG